MRRTLLSLEEAVRYASQFDIAFEIVVVLDNADVATRNLAEAYDYGVFDGAQVIHVRNGSLGTSRNDGIAVAHGEYIATADADDLVSFDYFQRLYITARAGNGRAIVFPEYYFGFGIDNYIWRLWEHRYIGSAALLHRHPYVSRVMFHRDVAQRVQFADVGLKSGYAYEDWHFNCECLAAGYSIEIARDAVLFYRQRPGSLLRRADAETSRLIPKSRFFEPSTYLKLTWAEFSSGGVPPTPDAPFFLADFLSRPGMGEIAAAANRIDPAISLGILAYSHANSNLAPVSPTAAAYFELCRVVAGAVYTDIVLLPFLTRGGAEKYILSLLEAIKELEPESRVLFLSGEPYDKHEWLDRLPEGSLFIDLHALGIANLSQADIEYVTFRLIQNMPGSKRLHLKTSPFAHDFVRKYVKYINSLDMYYYYFTNEAFVIDDMKFRNGHSFNFISDFGGYFKGIVSDHCGSLEEYSSAIGVDESSKLFPLYARVQENIRCKAGNVKTSRIFWASRIDEQKRPDLLKGISDAVAREIPSLEIHVFGGSAYGVRAQDVFADCRNMEYKGPFSGFESLPLEDYDAFLYTTRFDGLPNVILEALEAGLPVIAPDVDGIGEAVTAQTGYLIEDDVDDGLLVRRYVDAIKAVYADWPEALRRGQNGRELMRSRHSRQAYLDRVREIFALDPGNPKKGGSR